MNCDRARTEDNATLSKFEDQYLVIPQINQEHPENVFYDYLKEEHLRKVERLQIAIDKVDHKTEEVETVIKKIQTLDHYKFPEFPESNVDFDSMPIKGFTENNRDSAIKFRLICTQLNSIYEVVDKLVSDIREGNFEELKAKVDAYDCRKGRFSEVPKSSNSFTLQRNKNDNKENEILTRTQVKVSKRSKLRDCIENN